MNTLLYLYQNILQKQSIVSPWMMVILANAKIHCIISVESAPFPLQTAIGADIMMQLDDVVETTHTDPARFEEARHRTVRWLDRCIEAHKRPDRQNLFPIVQGGDSIISYGRFSSSDTVMEFL